MPYAVVSECVKVLSESMTCQSVHMWEGLGRSVGFDHEDQWICCL